MRRRCGIAGFGKWKGHLKYLRAMEASSRAVTSFSASVNSSFARAADTTSVPRAALRVDARRLVVVVERHGRGVWRRHFVAVSRLLNLLVGRQRAGRTDGHANIQNCVVKERDGGRARSSAHVARKVRVVVYGNQRWGPNARRAQQRSSVRPQEGRRVPRPRRWVVHDFPCFIFFLFEF